MLLIALFSYFLGADEGRWSPKVRVTIDLTQSLAGFGAEQWGSSVAACDRPHWWDMNAQRCFDVLPKLCNAFPAELGESFSLESLVSGITSAKEQEGVQDSDLSFQF